MHACPQTHAEMLTRGFIAFATNLIVGNNLSVWCGAPHLFNQVAADFVAHVGFRLHLLPVAPPVGIGHRADAVRLLLQPLCRQQRRQVVLREASTGQVSLAFLLQQKNRILSKQYQVANRSSSAAAYSSRQRLSKTTNTKT